MSGLSQLFRDQKYVSMISLIKYFYYDSNDIVQDINLIFLEILMWKTSLRNKNMAQKN